MSETEVMERRNRVKKKKILNTPIQLSSQQEKTIQELLCGHRRTFDSAFYRFSDFRVCWWLQACLRCCRFMLHTWITFFFSPWIERYFLWVRTAKLKARLHVPAPSLHRPPPLRAVPSKHKRSQRVNTWQKAVFSLLFRMWLTSQLTWSMTSLVSLKAFRTSGKYLHQSIYKCLWRYYFMINI